ncbi:hypothetical protein Pmani_005464 [Petrolisthes manimaculis]|uniref:Uncharacterized protein n=1 Tax=Petrolisthes manimaculis TaxID=1843537 RepID=A0AAE1UMV5_9EUCA|nr:hypothetical protein Pmani_005464 [Petrolisthes manimaculis]
MIYPSRASQPASQPGGSDRQVSGVWSDGDVRAEVEECEMELRVGQCHRRLQVTQGKQFTCVDVEMLSHKKARQKPFSNR